LLGRDITRRKAPGCFAGTELVQLLHAVSPYCGLKHTAFAETGDGAGAQRKREPPNKLREGGPAMLFLFFLLGMKDGALAVARTTAALV
jgi:hypothetical protein